MDSLIADGLFLGDIRQAQNFDLLQEYVSMIHLTTLVNLAYHISG